LADRIGQCSHLLDPARDRGDAVGRKRQALDEGGSVTGGARAIEVLAIDLDYAIGSVAQCVGERGECAIFAIGTGQCKTAGGHTGACEAGEDVSFEGHARSSIRTKLSRCTISSATL